MRSDPKSRAMIGTSGRRNQRQALRRRGWDLDRRELLQAGADHGTAVCAAVPSAAAASATAARLSLRP